MIKGVRLGTSYAGIRKSPEDDLTIIEICPDAKVSAVFTQNAFCAAPVALAKQRLEVSSPRYLLINAGNANAGTGEQGMQNAIETCQLISQQTGCEADQVLPFSTGVIGEQLDLAHFEAGIPKALENLQPDQWDVAAKAIMTTDTRPKQASRSLMINGQTIQIQGIAKGAGMIRPDMATMLAYIATDAELDSDQLNACLKEAVELSFNRISVDGDTSTNDACVLIATGKSIKPSKPEELTQFQEALNEVFIELAQAIVKDGEGATKFITIEVASAKDSKEALDVAYTIAHSPLVKTAFFASDPNWGRILAAIGRAGIDGLEIDKVSIGLADPEQESELALITNGQPDSAYTEEAGADLMANSSIAIKVDLQRGQASETVWTCDFSYDYVKINAEYRT